MKMREIILYYNPNPGPHVVKLKSVLVRMGIRIKNISKEQVTQKVGYLAGMPGFEKVTGQEPCAASGREPSPASGQEPETTETETGLPLIEEEMLVMRNFTSRRIDELLMNLRKAGVPKIALKAVVTESNSKWTFYQLYEEIKKEHEQMTEAARKEP